MNDSARRGTVDEFQRVRVDSNQFRLDSLRVLDALFQFRAEPEAQVGHQVGGEGRLDLRPILIRDVCIGNDIAAIRTGNALAQLRGEQEEIYPPLQVEPHDFRIDGERRVVYDHRTLRIGMMLEVSTRIEGSHNLTPFQREYAVIDERHDRIIDLRGSVAIVRGLLRLEFLHEPSIIIEFLFLRHICSYVPMSKKSNLIRRPIPRRHIVFFINHLPIQPQEDTLLLREVDADGVVDGLQHDVLRNLRVRPVEYLQRIQHLTA